METIVLEATVRDGKVKPNVIRSQKKVPAVYYGEGVKNMSLAVDYNEFRRAYLSGGENTIMDLKVGDTTHKALVYQVQLNPVTDAFSHVDFIAVDMNKEVTTHVALKFVGESEAVRSEGGMLITQLTEVTITCLAKDLVHEVEVDLSLLKDFNSVIHISGSFD